MTGKRFYVDVDDLRGIGTSLSNAGHSLNDERNHLQDSPADAGVSTERVATAVRSLLGGVAGLLGDLDTSLETLQDTQAEYLGADDRAKQGLRNVPAQQMPFLHRTDDKETSTPWWTR